MVADPNVSVTERLQRLNDGDGEAFDELFSILYDDLRAVARSQLRRLRPGHTLDTTALVHESYLKFLGGTRPSCKDRGHLCAIVARAMRQVLVDHARRAGRSKRGGGVSARSIVEHEAHGAVLVDQVIEIDEALGKLARYNPRLARVVEFRFFAGLTDKEIGELLGVTERTVRNEWARAKGWLREAMMR